MTPRRSQRINSKCRIQISDDEGDGIVESPSKNLRSKKHCSTGTHPLFEFGSSASLSALDIMSDDGQIDSNEFDMAEQESQQTSTWSPAEMASLLSAMVKYPKNTFARFMKILNDKHYALHESKSLAHIANMVAIVEASMPSPQPEPSYTPKPGPKRLTPVQREPSTPSRHSSMTNPSSPFQPSTSLFRTPSTSRRSHSVHGTMFGDHYQHENSWPSTMTPPPTIPSKPQKSMFSTSKQSSTQGLHQDRPSFPSTPSTPIVTRPLPRAVTHQNHTDRHAEHITHQNQTDRHAERQVEGSPSPNKTTAKGKYARRRRPWTDKEFDALLKGLQDHKQYDQCWKRIKEDPKYKHTLMNRTLVDLKDKARTERKARERVFGVGSRQVVPFERVTNKGADGARHYAGH